MRGLNAALWAEALKARRSKAPWLTALAVSLMPLMGGLFMAILKDPEWARRSGLIASKAQLTAGSADWPTYFGVLAQAIAVGGLIVFVMIVIWLFGREYSDHTAKDLLALPVAPAVIVGAKLIVAAGWSALLAALVYGLGLGVGHVVGLPGWSASLALHAAGLVALTAGLTILLVTPFALAASAGRGYLAAVGCMFLALFLAQIIAAMGWGAYFPWSVPALASGLAGPNGQEVGAISYLLVVLTGLLGIAGTLAWWQLADQT